MYWNRSAADISAAWQTEIESKLESGSTALLIGGKPDNMITSVATLLGMQNSTIQRSDVAMPYLLAGGNSAVWLGLLLSPQPSGSALVAPPPTVVYGGADEATYWSMVELSRSLAMRSPVSADAAEGGALPESSTHFTPRLQPGADTAWEMLPFVEVGEAPVTSAVATAPLGTGATIDPTGDWIAWGVMLLAFCLVLSALLI
jgi:hypothetical protein